MNVSVVVLGDEGLDPVAPEENRAGVETAVDVDLDAFDAWCASNLGEGLTKSERAIVKTYIGWKLGVAGE